MGLSPSPHILSGLKLKIPSLLTMLLLLAKYKKGHVTNQNPLSRMGNQGELGAVSVVGSHQAEKDQLGVVSEAGWSR